jgi:hypothetical protein
LDPLLLQVMSTYGWWAVAGLLLARWVGGYAYGRLFSAAPKPAPPPPLPPGVPDVHPVAPPDHPLLSAALEALYRARGRTPPSDLSRLHPAILGQLLAEAEDLLARHAPTAVPLPPSPLPAGGPAPK